MSQNFKHTSPLTTGLVSKVQCMIHLNYDGTFGLGVSIHTFHTAHSYSYYCCSTLLALMNQPLEEWIHQRSFFLLFFKH